MTSQGERWRLFVAIELPQTWLEALAATQRSLAEVFETPRTPRLRWVGAQGIHLTLKFLGNLPAGSSAHARLTTESDAVDRGQAEYAAQAAPWSSDSDARLHGLSEEALDVQRELAL